MLINTQNFKNKSLHKAYHLEWSEGDLLDFFSNEAKETGSTISNEAKETGSIFLTKK
jgi:hypothetical protein